MTHLNPKETGGVSPQKFETYLESWDGNWQKKLDSMPINKNTVIDIAFASYNFGSDGTLGGLQGGMTQADITNIINQVHAKGGQVKISLGGANPAYYISHGNGWPNSNTMANGIISAINKYKFDGVDFDVEDSPPPSNLADVTSQVIQQVRQACPSTDLTLTMPGQGWSNPQWVNLAKECAPSVNRISFMEYPLWIDPNGQGAGKPNSYVQQIEWDVNYYMQNWGIPKDKVQIGIMPGSDGTTSNDMTLNDAIQVAQFAKDNGMAGVMSWDMERDSAGVDGAASYAYSSAIESVLSSSDTQNPYEVSKSSEKKRTVTRSPAGPPADTVDPEKALKRKPKGLFDLK